MAVEMAPPPADQAPAGALTVADGPPVPDALTVADEPVPDALTVADEPLPNSLTVADEPGSIDDQLVTLLQQEGVARDPASASYLMQFLQSQVDGPVLDALTIADEPVPNALTVADRPFYTLLQQEGVARDPLSDSYLRQLERIVDEIKSKAGDGSGPAPSPEEAEFTAADWSSLSQDRERAEAKVAQEQEFLCSRMAAHSEPWIVARAVMRLGDDLAKSTQELLLTAGLSLLRGRYEEASKAMKAASKAGLEFSPSELKLFDQICRSALQNLKEQAAARKVDTEISEEAVILLSGVVDMIDNCLLPFCRIEDCVIYQLLKGDLLLFLADTCDDQHCAGAIAAYEEAFQYSLKTFDALHPYRIRAALSLSALLDKTSSSLRGYTIIRKAVEDSENWLKSAAKSQCSHEVLPYPELMKAYKEDSNRYTLEKIPSKEEDDQKKSRRWKTKAKELSEKNLDA